MVKIAWSRETALGLPSRVCPPNPPLAVPPLGLPLTCSWELSHQSTKQNGCQVQKRQLSSVSKLLSVCFHLPSLPSSLISLMSLHLAVSSFPLPQPFGVLMRWFPCFSPS